MASAGSVAAVVPATPEEPSVAPATPVEPPVPTEPVVSPRPVVSPTPTELEPITPGSSTDRLGSPESMPPPPLPLKKLLDKVPKGKATTADRELVMKRMEELKLLVTALSFVGWVIL